MINILNYLYMIFLCAVVGAFSSILGGVRAMIYGAMLAIGLAAVIPVVNRMKQRGTWNITRQVIAGGIAGLIIGLILWLIDISINKFFPTLRLPESWDRSTLILIGAPVIYGIIVHLAHGLCCYFKTTERFFVALTYAAFAISGFISLLPLVFSPYTLLLIFLAPWFNNFLFAILWGIVIHDKDPMFPEPSAESLKIKILKGCFEILYLMVIPGIICAVNLHISYRANAFDYKNQNKALLTQSSGVIYANDEALQLPQENTLKTGHYYLKSYFPNSPDGSKQASLDNLAQPGDNSQVVITDRGNAMELLRTKNLFSNCGICWHPSGDSVIAVQKNGENYLLKRVFMDGRIENFDHGIFPRLAKKTGDIAFVRDGWLYLRKKGSDKAEKKRKLLLTPDYSSGKVGNYDISPDAKMIVTSIQPLNEFVPFSTVTIYSLKPNEPGCILPLRTIYKNPCIWFENVEALKQAMKKPAKTKESNGK